MMDLRIALLLAGLTLFASPASSSVDSTLPAPGFELKSFDGVSFSLEDYADRTVVLEWFGHACEFTWSHYRQGHMSKLQEEYTARGVVWLTIDSSRFPLSREKMRARAEKWGIQSTAILKDSEGVAARRYGTRVTPQAFVIHHGRVVYQGAIDDRGSFAGLLQDRSTARNYVRQSLEEVLAGKPVSVPETKPYGCIVWHKK